MPNRIVLNITNQLRLTVIVLFLFALFNLAAIHFQVNSMISDGRIVNYAGIVRGGTQRLTKLEVLEQDTDEVVSFLNGIVKGLINGDENLQLVKVNDRAFQSKMGAVEQAWERLKPTLENYESNPDSEEKSRLLADSEEYWNLTNEAVSSAEAFSKHNVQKTKNLAILLFFVNLLILVIIWKITRSVEVRLKRTINTLTTSSTEISATIEQQERITNQQAASVNETTTTMDELEASCQQSSEQAKAASSAAQQALSLAEDGNQAARATMKGMYTLEEKVEAIAEQIVQLSGQADEIGSISLMVAELANRTHMLALNSSVEAIRAGEHGKGFAIVADEIRKLADQSQKSVEQISSLVSGIQKRINATVMVAEEGTKTVAVGVEATQKTTQAFAGVADAVNKVVLNNQQISLNLKQQVDAMQQVVEAMDLINRGAKETAAGISQTRIGTQQLNEVALALKRVV